MSSIQHLESSANEYIPSIETFKKRMQHILLNNRYVVEFGGSNFWDKYASYVRFMASAVTLPSWGVDSEQVYVGGTHTMLPNGFQKNNLDMTIYNTGPELQVMQNWLKETYNQETRFYGYFDDIKCDIKVMQYTTNGKLCQTFWFTDCTLFQISGISFSYDKASGPQSFNISLNYFGFSLETNGGIMTGAAIAQGSGNLSAQSASRAVAAAASSAGKAGK